MPTYEALGRFLRDFDRLTPEQQRQFRAAVEKFVEDRRRGRGLRPRLRVKGVQGAPGIYELTWADDGRATFAYSAPVQEGDPHVVWRRIGTHRCPPSALADAITAARVRAARARGRASRR